MIVARSPGLIRRNRPGLIRSVGESRFGRVLDRPRRVLAGKDVSITFASNDVSGADQTTYTFAGVSFSTPDSTRRLILGCGGAKAQDATLAINSATIDGVAMSLLKTELHSTANGAQVVALWGLKVPSGASGTVEFAFNTGVIRAGYALWAVYNASANLHDSVSSVAKPLALTINVAAGGGVIAYAGVNNTGGSPPEVTWTNLTERLDQIVESVMHHSGASDALATAEAARAVSADYAGTENFQAGVAVSFKKG